MKLLSLLLTFSLSNILMVACNADSTDIQNIKQKQTTDSVLLSKEDDEIKAENSTETTEIEDVTGPYISSDWEPRRTSTPASQSHYSYHLPEPNIRKIKAYFYDNIADNEVIEKRINEDDYYFSGYVEYNDNISITYYFDKDKGSYFSERFYLAIKDNRDATLNDFQKNIVYKMLQVNGVENPQLFFQELTASPKITKFTGCVVQQKQSKYSVIDLTFCEDDVISILTSYNPKSK
ncbi:hypothetical protein [Psychrobacter urativorans]|uniref:hypothetical protein n=1 Tax=Psychrobacter urativorans TaxID=45610 RepID=UPI003BB5B368